VTPGLSGGVHHVALAVRELAPMEAFYAGVLALPVVRRWPAADGGERSLWLDLGAGAFLALERVEGEDGGAEGANQGASPGRRGGWLMIALRIEPAARRDWRRRFTAAGFALDGHTPYTIYVRDPEGNRVGLSHHPIAVDADADADL
jgi:hypothetical protein